MDKTFLAKEYKTRLAKGIEAARETIHDPAKAADVISKLKREIDLVDTNLQTETINDSFDLSEFIKNNLSRKITLTTKTGNEITFMIDPVEVSVPKALDKFTRKFGAEKESDPAVLNQWGLYLTPPHGELIWQGKKAALIKSIRLTNHLNEPIYLLSGKFCFGIIKLGSPRQINIREFRELTSKHQITEDERKKWWPGRDILYYYPVSIIRRWDPPREWKVQKGAQIFVKDVKFEEISNSAKYIFLTRNEEDDEGDTREEGIVKEMELYGDWYKVSPDPKKTYNYVAQHHIRGNSIHTDLRMEVNDHLIGWTLDTPGSVSNPKHDKFLNPVTPSQGIDYQNLAERKLIQPKVWLTVKGKVPAGGIGATVNKEAEFRIVSSGKVKFGVQKHDFHEYFLYPDAKWNQDKNIKGRWITTYIPRPEHYKRAGEGKMMWAFWKPNDQRPYVEYQDYDEAVKKAKSEKGYMVWRDPMKGELKTTVDFRDNKKSSWVYK